MAGGAVRGALLAFCSGRSGRAAESDGERGRGTGGWAGRDCEGVRGTGHGERRGAAVSGAGAPGTGSDGERGGAAGTASDGEWSRVSEHRAWGSDGERR